MVEKLVDYRENTDEKTVISVKIWKVPKSKEFPEQIKYKLQAFNVETGKTILRYDNHNDAHEARHHKHLGPEETRKIVNPFKEVDAENEQQISEAIIQLINRFEKEVEER